MAPPIHNLGTRWRQWGTIAEAVSRRLLIAEDRVQSLTARSRVHNLNSSKTGRFIIFSVITNIYNKKTKGPTLMGLFTATGKLKKFFY